MHVMYMICRKNYYFNKGIKLIILDEADAII